MDEFSILIENVQIIEGSGKPSYKGSIGINEEGL